MKLIGIDLGGTKTEIVAIEDNPSNILFKKRIATQAHQGYLQLIEKINDLYQEAVTAIGEKAPLGIGIPGSISPKTGLVRNANTQMLNDKPFKKDLEDKLKIAIKIENDANCLALSEHYFGIAKGYSHSLSLIMGTGFGGGLVINNQLVSDFNKVAAELGHTSIDITGKKCWCGNRGCIERYLSGSALEEIYLENGGEPKKGPQIYQAYMHAEPVAISTIAQFIEFFGRALSNFCAVLDPEIIVIGGGLSKLEILYTQGYHNMCSKLSNKNNPPKLAPSLLGDASGEFGAAALNLHFNEIAS